LNAHLPEADTHDNPEWSRQHSTPTPPGAHTPLPAGGVLEPPISNYLAMVSDASTPRDSYGPKSFDDSNQGLAGEQPTDHDDDYHQPQKRKSIFSRPVFWMAASAAIVLIVLVVILPVYFTVIKKDKTAAASTTNGTPQPTASGKPGSPTSMVTGGDGSIITTANGVNFTYKNAFGGFCRSFNRHILACRPNFSVLRSGYADPNDPFNNNAQPNSWTPPLNTSWTWGKDKVYGYVSYSIKPIHISIITYTLLHAV